MSRIVHSSALDGLRGLSAQVVFIGHLIATLAAVKIFGWPARAAVIVFFCLSGFVITSSVRHARSRGGFSLLRFGMRRIARIYPPYILAIAVAWAVFAVTGPSGTMSFSSVVGELTRAFTFLNLGSDVITRIDGPLWSLRLEVIAYVITGFLAYAVLSGSSRLHSIFSATFALLLAVSAPFFLSFGLAAFCWFGFGALASLGVLRVMEPFSFAGSAILFVVGMILPLATGNSLAIEAADTIPAMLYQIIFAVFVSSWIRKLGETGSAVLTRCHSLAGFSYTLYVLHMPIIIGILAITPVLPQGSLATLAIVLLSFTIVELAAWYAGSILERPDFFYDIVRRGLVRVRLVPELRA